MHDLWPEILASPLGDGEDTITWALNAMGFTLHSAWNAICPQSLALPWAKFIWCKGVIPRHAFCAWSALHRCLLTHDLLQQWWFALVSRCSLCRDDFEMLDHLLWSCNFSSQVWDMFCCRLSSPSISGGSLHDAANQLLHNFQQLPMAVKVQQRFAHAFTVVISYLWIERNCRFFDGAHIPKVPADICHEAFPFMLGV